MRSPPRRRRQQPPYRCPSTLQTQPLEQSMSRTPRTVRRKLFEIVVFVKVIVVNFRLAGCILRRFAGGGLRVGRLFGIGLFIIDHF